MPSDDILAANLWPWPDPLLKRDPAGNVLFVNAAFLQLYGGRVEDWAGKSVAGWPAPNNQGAHRFETRTGDAGGETIYDWVEMVMVDGNAIAIARNITAFIAPSTPPAEREPVFEERPELPPLASSQAETTSAPEMPAPPAAPVAPPPAQPEPVFEQTPNPQTVPQNSELVTTKTTDFEDTLDNGADDYAYDNNGSMESAPSLAAETQASAASANPVLKQPDRATERRALPIEDSASILGSNWRDQVIAKAIGEDMPTEDKPVQSLRKQTLEETVDEPEESASAGLNILLAEDNAINALLTRTLLEADGAIVETVEDGALAVTAAQNQKYDLILMDMRMPNMDGLESTRKIRALGGHNKTIPIVALTANAFDDDRNACFDSGMNDFMTKPVSAEELAEMVHNWTKEKPEEKLAS